MFKVVFEDYPDMIVKGGSKSRNGGKEDQPQQIKAETSVATVKIGQKGKRESPS